MLDDDPATPSDDDLAALLDWYLACGVDLAVDAAPHDRFTERAMREKEAAAAMAKAAIAPPRQQERAPPAIATSASETRARAAPLFPEEAARLAGETAAGAQDLAQLAARLASFEGCALKSMAAHFLFSAGTPGARLMVLDFAPGEEEERSGLPFSGRAAALLDNMLAAIGLNRETSYLAYFSPWRPPGDKTANVADEAALLPFARRHVELAAPDVLLILGEQTARGMLQTNFSDAQLRGRWFDCACGERTARTVVLPTLANVLRTPLMKRNVWRDLQMAAAALREP